MTANMRRKANHEPGTWAPSLHMYSTGAPVDGPLLHHSKLVAHVSAGGHLDVSTASVGSRFPVRRLALPDFLRHIVADDHAAGILTPVPVPAPRFPRKTLLGMQRPGWPGWDGPHEGSAVHEMRLSGSCRTIRGEGCDVC